MRVVSNLLAGVVTFLAVIQVFLGILVIMILEPVGVLWGVAIIVGGLLVMYGIWEVAPRRPFFATLAVICGVVPAIPLGAVSATVIFPLAIWPFGLLAVFFAALTSGTSGHPDGASS
jgi:hypothetical protein